MAVSPRFRYRASTGSGEVVEGVLECSSRQEVLDQLRSRELHAISVDELSARNRRSGGRVRADEAVARWARNVATLLGAGTPLERALRVSRDQAGHPGLANVLASIRDAVQEGETLSDALARHPEWFPRVVPAMSRAGEASGEMGQVFAQVADYLEEAGELRSQVRAALLYPALMSVVAGVGVAVLLLFVVPRFADILADFGGSLPMSTRLLMGFGSFLGSFWWLVVLGAVALAAVAARWLRDPRNLERWHEARLTWPVWGDLESKLITARFIRTLGLLLTHGVPLLASLRIARASVQNRAVARKLDEAVATVAEGATVAQSVHAALPDLAVEMLAVGEESGRLDAMCTRVADTYDGEVRRTVKTAVSLIEPVMIVVFGILVGFIALAMLQAIYSVNTNLG